MVNLVKVFFFRIIEGDIIKPYLMDKHEKTYTSPVIKISTNNCFLSYKFLSIEVFFFIFIFFYEFFQWEIS